LNTLLSGKDQKVHENSVSKIKIIDTVDRKELKGLNLLATLLSKAITKQNRMTELNGTKGFTFI
jgi:hypothetical protein